MSKESVEKRTIPHTRLLARVKEHGDTYSGVTEIPEGKIFFREVD